MVSTYDYHIVLWWYRSGIKVEARFQKKDKVILDWSCAQQKKSDLDSDKHVAWVFQVFSRCASSIVILTPQSSEIHASHARYCHWAKCCLDRIRLTFFHRQLSECRRRRVHWKSSYLFPYRCGVVDSGNSISNQKTQDIGQLDDCGGHKVFGIYHLPAWMWKRYHRYINPGRQKAGNFWKSRSCAN